VGGLNELLIQLELSISQRADGTDKGFPKDYLDNVYQPLVGSRRSDDFDVLEIGIRSGASLMLWHEFFTRGRIVGIDNQSDISGARNEWTSGSRMEIVAGDAYCQDTLHLVKGDFDLIIDDGPHSPESQRWALKNWAMRLKPDGCLVIEDIQGGIPNLYYILEALNSNFCGCARVVDSREATGQADSLVLIIHRCGSACSISQKKELSCISNHRLRRLLAPPYFHVRSALRTGRKMFRRRA
jgi:SAM-dependent methyltransferase